ncbi:MAG: HTTM domain-containing protein [Chloroflexota bacterium]|nr:HTTM domain-containing protein [Chloroflexota bacterium]MDE2959805.1 HTTM domain-containing protein [Chloroflexota bacterium]
MRFLDWLAGAQVDGASVAAFRAIFGLLGVLVVVRFFAHGWIGPLYVEPDHHFTYLGFGWVRPWPGWGMHAHFIALGLLSLGIAAGYRSRLCAALFCIGFTYVEPINCTESWGKHVVPAKAGNQKVHAPAIVSTARISWISAQADMTALAPGGHLNREQSRS